jgi:hypothetical protein
MEYCMSRPTNASLALAVSLLAAQTALCQRTDVPVACEVQSDCTKTCSDDPAQQCENSSDCGPDGECVDRFCVDGFCCDSPCPFPGRCDAFGFEGLCLDRGDYGDPCTFNDDCASGFCRDEVCCWDDCQNGRCNEEGVCVPFGVTQTATPLSSTPTRTPTVTKTPTSGGAAPTATVDLCGGSCPAGEQCNDQGQCVPVNPCEGRCPIEDCFDGTCIFISRSGGCSTVGSQPARPVDLLVLLLLPGILWGTRRSRDLRARRQRESRAPAARAEGTSK